MEHRRPSPDGIIGSSDVSCLFRRVKAACCQKGSPHFFEAVCADMVLLWAALNCTPPKTDAARRELLSLWPKFLRANVTHLVSGASLSCFRPLLEAIVAAAQEPAIAEFSDVCVDEIACALIDRVSTQTLGRSSLIPPLDVIRRVAGLIELLQEYHLTRSGNTVELPGSMKKLVEAYNALLDWYATIFVEELAFPSYWNLNWEGSSSCALVDGVHPSIYFCFTSFLTILQAWRRCSCSADDRPCRQLLARLWQRSALGILSVVEENKLSDTRKQQMELDVVHFVLFARMFRGFVGERLFSGVSAHLVRVLEALAMRVGAMDTATAAAAAAAPDVCASFEAAVWNVPPITMSEWMPSSGGGEMGAFTPWSTMFIRASHVKAARMLPKGWMCISFQQML